MKLSKIFCDGMVFQHNKPIYIYGEGEGEIEVAFSGRHQTVTALNGKWCVEYEPFECGGPHALKVVQNDEKILIRDIWVGEVIVCTGMPEISKENSQINESLGDSMLRLHNGERWIKCDVTDNAAAFMHKIGAKIQYELRCPVGIISCSADEMAEELNSYPIAGVVCCENSNGLDDLERLKLELTMRKIPLTIAKSNDDDAAQKICANLQARGAIGESLVLRLGEIFCDSMVLQRGKPIRVFGEARGEVSVEFLGETKSVSADGRFDVEFSAKPAGGPYELKAVCGEKTVILKDIMIGEVILCAGQSNMELHVSETTRSPEPFVNDNMLRTFSSERPHGGEPIRPRDGWVKASPENIPGWSSLAYYWGVEARKVLCSEGNDDIAVGLVVCSQGGSMIQAWIEEEKYIRGGNLPADRTTDPVVYTWNFIGELYRYMFETLIPYSFGNVIWYQGENNGRAVECDYYGQMLEMLIENWREVLRDENLPFAVVVLPDYIKHEDMPCWEKIKQEQRDTAAKVPGVIAVESADLCENDDIHPPTKWKLAKHLWEEMYKAKLIEK